MSHTHKQQTILWLAALSMIMLGLYLSYIQFMMSEWLSRAGCLVVILGIWSSLGSIIQERVLMSRLHMRRRAALVRARRRQRANKMDQEAIDKELADIENTFLAQATKLEQELKFSMGVLEVSLLITGTFLWGFGDLIVYALFD
jgi:uncharacterized membrane protein YcjF (UPF0283 family)